MEEDTVQNAGAERVGPEPKTAVVQSVAVESITFESEGVALSKPQIRGATESLDYHAHALLAGKAVGGLQNPNGGHGQRRSKRVFHPPAVGNAVSRARPLLGARNSDYGNPAGPYGPTVHYTRNSTISAAMGIFAPVIAFLHNNFFYPPLMPAGISSDDVWPNEFGHKTRRNLAYRFTQDARYQFLSLFVIVFQLVIDAADVASYDYTNPADWADAGTIDANGVLVTPNVAGTNRFPVDRYVFDKSLLNDIRSVCIRCCPRT